MRVLVVLAAAIGGITLASLIARRSGGGAFTLPTGWDFPSDDITGPPTDDEVQPPTTLFDDLVAMTDPRSYIPAFVDDATAETNLRAFGDTVAYSEGTAQLGDRGYNVMFGGRLFSSYADHPRQLFPFTDRAGRQLFSSAAGRYQFLRATWDELRAKLQLPDFSPASQELAFRELLRRRGALNDVRAGRFAMALDKCRKEWASLPGAGYDQGERSFASLQSAFVAAGGTLST
jgi:lysozyme